MKTYLNTCASVALSVALLGCETTGNETSSITPRPITASGATPLSADLESALRQAQTQRRNKDYEQASHTLSQLVLVAPDDPRVLGEYGKVLIAQTRTEDAIAFLERAAQLNQKDWTIFSALGIAYDQKGDYKSAQVAYAHALALKPGDPTILSNAALSHLQKGDIATARALMQQAARAGGADPKIAKNLALIESLSPKPVVATAAAPVRTAQPAKPATATAATQPAKPAVTAAQQPAKPATATAAATPAKPVTATATAANNRPATTTTAAQTKPVQAKPVATTAPAVLRRGN